MKYEKSFPVSECLINIAIFRFRWRNSYLLLNNLQLPLVNLNSESNIEMSTIPPEIISDKFTIEQIA